MILNFILWFICELIEIFAIVKIYKKVESKVKSRFYFICLCIFTVIIAPLASLINLLLYYIILMVQPFLFYAYFYKKEKLPNYLSLFLSFFLYLATQASSTFFSVIISSITGDQFVKSNWAVFYITINSVSVLFMLKSIDYFEFQLRDFKDSSFKKTVQKINIYYFLTILILNVSHWLSEDDHFNSFSSMLATICFLIFMTTLFYLKAIREKYEKEEEIRQRELEQLQLQQYTDEIVSLYNEIRGFRHDYAGMLTSFQTAINTQDIKEIEKIYQEVLVDANLKLRSDKYTYFDLNNVGDSALRSVMTETLFKAREHQIDLTFEVKEPVETLPIKLLDVVRMASILLNNAVEGAIESYEKMIHVTLVQLDTEIIFVVKNSRKQRKLDLEEIYEPEFSTKGCRRGLGLNNLKEILENYEYIMLDTEISKYDFTQVLTIKRRNSL